MLLLYEDAHWIDPTTLELLSARRRAHPAAAVLCCCHLPAGVPAALDRPCARDRAELNRLGRRQGAAMVAQVTGGKPLPAGGRRADRGQDRRRAAVRRGADQDGARIRACLRTRATTTSWSGPLPPLAIPATLHDSLMARLDRLARGQGGGADRGGDRPGVLPSAAGRGRPTGRRVSCTAPSSGWCRPSWSSAAVRRPMRPMPSSMRWCRTPPIRVC